MFVLRWWGRPLLQPFLGGIQGRRVAHLVGMMCRVCDGLVRTFMAVYDWLLATVLSFPRRVSWEPLTVLPCSLGAPVNMNCDACISKLCITATTSWSSNWGGGLTSGALCTVASMMEALTCHELAGCPLR